jgi:hypothetical protein
MGRIWEAPHDWREVETDRQDWTRVRTQPVLDLVVAKPIWLNLEARLKVRKSSSTDQLELSLKSSHDKKKKENWDLMDWPRLPFSMLWFPGLGSDTSGSGTSGEPTKLSDGAVFDPASEQDENCEDDK